MKPLVVIAGPTAVGKTRLSIQMAKASRGSVISADAMQVYHGMDIGSAKIKREEMEGIPHYLVDIIDPDESWNVARFQQLAKEAMEEIYAQGRIPMIVGGTGFYIQSVVYDIDFSAQKEDPAYREQLEDFVRVHGSDAL